MNDADGLSLLNDVHRDILARVHLQSDIEEVTALTTSTRLYDLATTVSRVWWCRYQRSSAVDDYAVLQPISLETLETENQRYLMQSDAEPRVWYTAHGSGGRLQVGVDPAPATASTGSPEYPRLILRVTRAESLSSSTVLPAGVPTLRAWWKGLIAFWDELNNPDVFDHSNAEYEAEIQKLMNWRQEVNAKVRPKVHPWQTTGMPSRV